MTRDGGWEPVIGFDTDHAYRYFRAHLETRVLEGSARRVEVDPNYGRAMIYGGEWFEDVLTGEVWRLVEPDPPFMGVWERVIGYGPDPFRSEVSQDPAAAEPREVPQAPEATGSTGAMGSAGTPAVDARRARELDS